MEQIRRFIFTGQCPICKNGKAYRCLANHVQQAHGISAFELREMAGLGRGTSICDPDFREYCRDRQKRIANLGFLNYDRHQFKGRDGTKSWDREASRATRLKVAKSCEHLNQFREAMGKVDRKAVNNNIPASVKAARNLKGGLATLHKYGKGYYRILRSKRNAKQVGGWDNGYIKNLYQDV